MAANRPTNVTNRAAGHPPANYPAPAAGMPTGPDVTHISVPAAWPTTAPVLGGVGTGAPPSGVDSAPEPDIPAGMTTLSRQADLSVPVNLGTLSPSNPVGPAGQVTLPSGQRPQATTSETLGEAPFVGDGPIANPGGLVIRRLGQ